MDSKEDVSEFEKLEQQLHSFLAEISELSKKKPNDPLNKFKLRFINSTLEALNKLLGEYRPFDDFEQFDVDTLPTNSDVVLILSQYTGAALRFREDMTVFDQQRPRVALDRARKDFRPRDRAAREFQIRTEIGGCPTQARFWLEWEIGGPSLALDVAPDREGHEFTRAV